MQAARLITVTPNRPLMSGERLKSITANGAALTPINVFSNYFTVGHLATDASTIYKATFERTGKPDLPVETTVTLDSVSIAAIHKLEPKDDTTWHPGKQTNRPKAVVHVHVHASDTEAAKLTLKKGSDSIAFSQWPAAASTDAYGTKLYKIEVDIPIGTTVFKLESTGASAPSVPDTQFSVERSATVQGTLTVTPIDVIQPSAKVFGASFNPATGTYVKASEHDHIERTPGLVYWLEVSAKNTETSSMHQAIVFPSHSPDAGIKLLTAFDPPAESVPANTTKTAYALIEVQPGANARIELPFVSGTGRKAQLPEFKQEYDLLGWSELKLASDTSADTLDISRGLVFYPEANANRFKIMAAFTPSAHTANRKLEVQCISGFTQAECNAIVTAAAGATSVTPVLYGNVLASKQGEIRIKCVYGTKAVGHLSIVSDGQGRVEFVPFSLA